MVQKQLLSVVGNHSKSDSLRSWRDFAREYFCFGSEAVNTSGGAVRGLVKKSDFFLTQIEYKIARKFVKCIPQKLSRIYRKDQGRKLD